MLQDLQPVGLPFSIPYLSVEPIFAIPTKIGIVAKSIFTSLQKSPDAFVNSLELLRNGIQIYDQIKNIPLFLKEFNLSLDSFGYAFYTLRLPFYYLEYFVHSIKDDEPLAILGNILYFFSDIGSSLNWFNDIKAINLAKLSEQFGKIRYIGALVKIPLSSAISVFCGFSYLFFGMDAIVRLSRGNLDRKERFLAWLDLTNSIIQVVLMVLLLCASISTPVTLGLTIASGCISTISFAMRYGKMFKTKSVDQH